MKRLLVASIACALLILRGPAGAADIAPTHNAPPPISPPPVFTPTPAYNWTGVFFGIVGGGAGLGSASQTFTDGSFKTGDYKISGGLGGATWGVNVQSGSLVVGLEADLEWALINGSVSVNGVPLVGSATYASRLQWLHTFHVRIGYAFDRFLPFVALGPAYGGVKVNASMPGLGPVSSVNTWQGWSVGGGLEYGVTPNLTLKAEWIYVCLGETTLFSGDNADFMTHMIRVGLNYKYADVFASMPPKAPVLASIYDWTGFYLGLNIGGHTGSQQTDYRLGGVPIGSITNNIQGGRALTGLSGVPGLQAGGIWQTGMWVFGLETDAQISGQQGNSRLFATMGGVTATLDHNQKLLMFLTLRGRLGVAVDRWLFYTTGGLAYGEVQTLTTLTVPGFGSITTNSEKSRPGWIVGGGVEMGLMDNWTGRMEYLYMALSGFSDNFTGVGPFGGSISATSSAHDHIIRIAVNRRFN